MRNNSYAPHYAISRYSIREFNTGADTFMVAMIIIYYYYYLLLYKMWLDLYILLTLGMIHDSLTLLYITIPLNIITL